MEGHSVLLPISSSSTPLYAQVWRKESPQTLRASCLQLVAACWDQSGKTSAAGGWRLAASFLFPVLTLPPLICLPLLHVCVPSSTAKSNLPDSRGCYEMLDFFHVCVHVCVYVHAHVHTSTCVCQRTTLSDVLRDSINSFEIGFSQAWSAEIKLANKFQEPPRLCLHTTGMASVTTMISIRFGVCELTSGPCAWEARHFLAELSFQQPQC